LGEEGVGAGGFVLTEMGPFYHPPLWLPLAETSMERNPCLPGGEEGAIDMLRWRMHAHPRTRMLMYLHTHSHIHIRTTHTLAYTHKHSYTQTLMHTHTHTHTH